MRTASQRGRLSRTKGGAFERKIVRMLKARLPHATIRRGKQSHLADEPDVVVAGGGDQLWDRLWLELQDARTPTPELKAKQADRDSGEESLPIAVTHKLGAKTIQATMPYWVLDEIVNGLVYDPTYMSKSSNETVMVTLDFADLLAVLP